MPGLPVRVLRAPSSAARSARSRYHRRRLAAVAVAAVMATISTVTPGHAPAVRADAPPQYYAIALGPRSDVQSVVTIGENGQMGAVLNGGRIARVDGVTVTPLTSDNGASLSGMSANGTLVGTHLNRAVRVDGTTETTLSGLDPANGEYANAIDPSGTIIVGASGTPTGEQLSWMDVGGTVTPLPVPDAVHTNTYAAKVDSTGLDRGDRIEPDHGRDHVRHLAGRRRRRPRVVRRARTAVSST